jgi:cytochrome c-type biogenesis protein CcmF
MILAFFMGGSLMLFAWRGAAMEAKGVFATVSRESALVLNNVLLAVSTFVVFIGTMWPLVAEMFFDRTLSVGPALLRRGLHALRLRRRVALPIGAMLPWKRAGPARPVRALMGALILAVAWVALAWAM